MLAKTSGSIRLSGFNSPSTRHRSPQDLTTITAASFTCGFPSVKCVPGDTTAHWCVSQCPAAFLLHSALKMAIGKMERVLLSLQTMMGVGVQVDARFDLCKQVCVAPICTTAVSMLLRHLPLSHANLFLLITPSTGSCLENQQHRTHRSTIAYKTTTKATDREQ